MRARRRGRGDAATLARAYSELLSPLLTLTADSQEMGLRLFESTERVGAFDAVLAAAAMTSGATALVSVDAAFAEIPQLGHTVPDAPGIRRLLADST